MSLSNYEEEYKKNLQKELPDFLASKDSLIKELKKLHNNCVVQDKTFEFDQYYTDKVFSLLFDGTHKVTFICGAAKIKDPKKTAEYLVSWVGK